MSGFGEPFGGSPFGGLGGVDITEINAGFALAQTLAGQETNRLAGALALTPVAYAEQVTLALDGLALAGSATAQAVQVLSAAMATTGTAAGVRNAQVLINDALALGGAIRAIYQGNISDTLATTGAINAAQIVALIDYARLTGASTTTLKAIADIVDSLTLASVAASVQNGAITDNVALVAAIETQLAYFENLISAAAFSDTTVGLALVTVALSDGIVFDETVTPIASLIAAIHDGLDFAVGFDLGEDSYVAYSMNAATKGLTSYTNFDFNSLASFNGNIYAAGAAGLYRLGGTTDAGDDISWRIRTGLTNFGTGANKGMDAAYIGYTATGRVVLKCVVVAPTGDKKAYLYELTTPAAGAMHPGRILVGRGLKAVYWAFELTNIDEGSIELDTLELHPVVFEGRLP